jgi:hypothetical protein
MGQRAQVQDDGFIGLLRFSTGGNDKKEVRTRLYLMTVAITSCTSCTFRPLRNLRSLFWSAQFIFKKATLIARSHPIPFT